MSQFVALNVFDELTKTHGLASLGKLTKCVCEF